MWLDISLSVVILILAVRLWKTIAAYQASVKTWEGTNGDLELEIRGYKLDLDATKRSDTEEFETIRAMIGELAGIHERQLRQIEAWRAELVEMRTTIARTSNEEGETRITVAALSDVLEGLSRDLLNLKQKTPVPKPKREPKEKLAGSEDKSLRRPGNAG